MKKGYKECPYCANEIKEKAIKCQHCGEFLDKYVGDAIKEENLYVEVKNNNGVKSKKRNKYFLLRKLGVFLIIIPIILCIWSAWLLNFSMYDVDINKEEVIRKETERFVAHDLLMATNNIYHYDSGLTTTQSLFLKLCVISIMLFIICAIIGIILLIISKFYKEYNSKIKLLTPSKFFGEDYYLMPGIYGGSNYDCFYIIPYESNNNTKYKNYIYREDIENMKQVGFIKKHSVVGIVLLNIFSFGTFGRLYNLLQYDYLPKIKSDDCESGIALLRYFIPIVNIIRFFSFRTRLVNRINFQYKIRNKQKPIAKRIVIVFLITLLFAKYIGFFLSIIFSSIYIGQLQKGINGLVDENQKVSED